MADFNARSLRSGRQLRHEGKEWSLVLGVVASVLALTYLAAGLHARYVVGASPASSASPWFPLQLFVIAVSPALAGFIFLWSERHVQSKATQKMLRNIGIFGFGLALAFWGAFVLK
jgi:hypothetical protein